MAEQRPEKWSKKARWSRRNGNGGMGNIPVSGLLLTMGSVLLPFYHESTSEGF